MKLTEKHGDTYPLDIKDFDLQPSFQLSNSYNLLENNNMIGMRFNISVEFPIL